MRKHRYKTTYPVLWQAVAGALRSAQYAHPEFVIPTPESIVKRVVGSLLAPEVRAALAVETERQGNTPPDVRQQATGLPVGGRGDSVTPAAPSPMTPGNVRCMDCRCGGYGCPGMPPGYEQNLVRDWRL